MLKSKPYDEFKSLILEKKFVEKTFSVDEPVGLLRCIEIWMYIFAFTMMLANSHMFCLSQLIIFTL
jgi:hypothetical protein